MNLRTSRTTKLFCLVAFLSLVLSSVQWASPSEVEATPPTLTTSTAAVSGALVLGYTGEELIKETENSLQNVATRFDSQAAVIMRNLERILKEHLSTPIRELDETIRASVFALVEQANLLADLTRHLQACTASDGKALVDFATANLASQINQLPATSREPFLLPGRVVGPHVIGQSFIHTGQESTIDLPGAFPDQSNECGEPTAKIISPSSHTHDASIVAYGPMNLTLALPALTESGVYTVQYRYFERRGVFGWRCEKEATVLSTRLPVIDGRAASVTAHWDASISCQSIERGSVSDTCGLTNGSESREAHKDCGALCAPSGYRYSDHRTVTVNGENDGIATINRHGDCVTRHLRANKATRGRVVIPRYPIGRHRSAHIKRHTTLDYYRMVPREAVHRSGVISDLAVKDGMKLASIVQDATQPLDELAAYPDTFPARDCEYHVSVRFVRDDGTIFDVPSQRGSVKMASHHSTGDYSWTFDPDTGELAVRTPINRCGR